MNNHQETQPASGASLLTVGLEDRSRMYAALRCIEEELKKETPSMKRIKEIMAECKRKLSSNVELTGGLTAESDKTNE